MKKIPAILVLIFFYSGLLSAQDMQFSMPYSSWMNLNPAFAGSTGASKVTGSYHNQWPNISGTHVSSFLSYDQHVKMLHGGLGISYHNEILSQGTLKKNVVTATYAAHIPVCKNKFIMCPAVAGAYSENRTDWSLYTFSAGPQMLNKEIVSYPDFSAGLLGYNKQFNAGIAVFHLTEPEEGFFSGSSLPMKYVAHFGATIGNPDSVREFSMSPTVLFISQDDYRTVEAGISIQYRNCLAGVSYRNGDDLFFKAGFAQGSFRMAYCYGMLISDLGTATAGSHEISLSFIFNKKLRVPDFMNFSSAAF